MLKVLICLVETGIIPIFVALKKVHIKKSTTSRSGFHMIKRIKTLNIWK